jgi:hypothetical protein
MYFPKSQIKTNLNTKGGEFIIESTGEDYAGAYFTTSTGKYYTGKNPQDQPVRLLIELQSKVVNDQTLGIQTTKITNEQKSTIWTWDYLASPISNNKIPSPPVRIYPTPTQEDYDLGEIQRYFLSKTNEPKYIEINKEQYQRYVDGDKNVSYQLYQPITLPWDISGDRNQVYNTNKNIVAKTERDNQLRGFKSYFKERYDQFYK